MNANEQLRQRMRAFDPATQAELSAEQRAQVVSVVRKEGPAIIRRARQRTVLLRAVGAGVGIAAAFTLISVWPWSRAERTVNVITPPIAPAACSQDATEGSPSFEPTARGRHTLEFARARAVAEADSQVSVTEFSPCRTTLTLEHGALTVLAHDLGGGELKVRANEQEVIVRGTLFRVEAHDAGMRVTVEHGRVTVHRSGRLLATVNASQTARIDPQGAHLSELAPEEAERLRRAVLDEAHAEAEVPARDTRPTLETRATPDKGKAPHLTVRGAQSQNMTPEAMFDEAEARWRRGDKQAARALYRRVGTSGSQIAETAWLRLARLEIAQGGANAALAALRARKKHAGSSELAAEAAWLEVEALGIAGRYGQAESAAKQLIRDFPKSAQAGAAQRLLAKPSTP
jgi:hypothetical protein